MGSQCWVIEEEKVEGKEEEEEEEEEEKPVLPPHNLFSCPNNICKPKCETQQIFILFPFIQLDASSLSPV